MNLKGLDFPNSGSRSAYGRSAFLSERSAKLKFIVSLCVTLVMPAFCLAQQSNAFLPSAPKPEFNVPVVDPDPGVHAEIRRTVYNGNEWLRDGYVWHATQISIDGRKQYVWQQSKIDSCDWCGRPMTFKHAMFDKPALIIWGSLIAANVAHIEYDKHQACVVQQTCIESNFLYGRNPSRLRYYSISLSALTADWMITAKVRKGNKRLHIGGLSVWYIMPAIEFLPMAYSWFADHATQQAVSGH